MRRCVFLVLTVLLTVCLPLIAMAGEPNPAKGWDKHFDLWLVISIVIWLVVTVPLIYFVVKYRRKKADEEGADIHGNAFLEVLWTAIPTVIVILLGVQSWALYREYRAVPQNAYEVIIEGFQFGYEIKHPEGIKELNELHVPAGTPVKVLLTSRDVIHTFSIPKFRVKEDMIPGRTTYMWFRADEPGEYPVFCSEYCGTSHSLMRAKVIAMKKEDFQSYMAMHKEAAAAMTPEAKGEKLVKDLGCVGCHSLTGETGAGPTFKGMFGSERTLADGKRAMADKQYVEESIVNPKAKVVKGFEPSMPPYSLSDTDLDAIAAYLAIVK